MTLDYFYGQSGELFSYFRIPKALFQDHRFRQLSTDARTLYGILLDRMSLSAKNGWLDEQGRVYIIYTVREVQESLCCAEHKAVKLFRELEDIDLIERKRRGLGRPSLIYVKDFSSGLPKAQVQNCPNSNSGAAESTILEQPKPQANKTDKNKTEWNDPDPIYSGGIRNDNNLKALQEAVGGTIAAVYPFADPVAIICNDEGKLMGLPLNRALRDENRQMYDAIAGTFLVVGLGEEDFASLIPEMAQKYEQLFHQPEAFLKLGNRLLVLPVPDEPPAEKPRTKPPAEHDR